MATTRNESAIRINENDTRKSIKLQGYAANLAYYEKKKTSRNSVKYTKFKSLPITISMKYAYVIKKLMSYRALISVLYFSFRYLLKNDLRNRVFFVSINSI